ncbi:hypothetical protein X560_2272 [Listeria fleischmannii 1991]|uniref:CsbD-like n=2 Tax=Listeria fleischmannii TaxID=1069827 RepID=A0A2X3GSI7_9LIST|nr:CsbD family protein [Listeria fleischmannii]EMG28356.1 hypothetical protein LFLEISCH_05729 [Listeria fleischmannii subsp. fleischmannii LU2006-1]KMT58446.1 hypothetical protein X560_2272 [Listeria fleischmannii 1991]SQC71438.1 CsbD-like [Listeria fleischmannii subsp. fleischmannii]
MTEDKGLSDILKGAKDKVVGEAKDSYGKLTGDKAKQGEGKAQKAKGTVNEKVGEAKDKLSDE